MTFLFAGRQGFIGDPGEEGPEGVSYGGDPGKSVLCVSCVNHVLHHQGLLSANVSQTASSLLALQLRCQLALGPLGT